MNPVAETNKDEPDIEADRLADAMKTQLRKDVASWAAARSGEGPDPGPKSAAPAAKPTAAPRAARKAKPVEVARPVALEPEKKPFRMSYDGTTDRDYIAQRIKLGAR